jgi:hypothetical protein
MKLDSHFVVFNMASCYILIQWDTEDTLYNVNQ